MTSALRDVPLLASAFTSAGDAKPRRGDGTSPVDLPNRIDLVAATGWTGMGIGHADIVRARERFGLPRIAALLANRGIVAVELEFLRDWWTTGERRTASDRVRRDLLEAAAHLGPATIKLGAYSEGEPTTREHLAAELARLAAEAAVEGARVILEPMPSCDLVPSITDGVELVTSAGNANAGLVVDSYHMARAGTSPDEVVRALPLDRVFAVEIADGRREVIGTLFEDAINERLLPGTGELDVAGFAAAVHALGYRGHWGVEMISAGYRRLPVNEALKAAYQSARATLEEAEARRLSEYSEHKAI